MYYEPFTSALHEVIKDFKLPVNELGYFVTRIEEEHLWVSTNINFKLKSFLSKLDKFWKRQKDYKNLKVAGNCLKCRKKSKTIFC